MTKPRTVKNVSFADTEYERGLLDYATKPEHGPFSVYVKRLIEQDRAGVKVQAVAITQEVGHIVQASTTARPAPTQKERSAALDML